MIQAVPVETQQLNARNPQVLDKHLDQYLGGWSLWLRLHFGFQCGYRGGRV